MWTRRDKSTAFRERESEKAGSEGIRRPNGGSSSACGGQGGRPTGAPQKPGHARRRPLSGAPQNGERRLHLAGMVETVGIELTSDGRRPRTSRRGTAGRQRPAGSGLRRAAGVGLAQCGPARLPRQADDTNALTVRRQWRGNWSRRTCRCYPLVKSDRGTCSTGHATVWRMSRLRPFRSPTSLHPTPEVSPAA
jgi:hypothetical protein